MKVSDDQVEFYYRQGLSGAKIAAMAGVSRATIYRLLFARGVLRRKPGARDLQLDRDAVLLMYKAAGSADVVAGHFGCHRSTIMRVVRASGLRPASPR